MGKSFTKSKVKIIGCSDVRKVRTNEEAMDSKKFVVDLNQEIPERNKPVHKQVLTSSRPARMSLTFDDVVTKNRFVN